MGVRRTAFAPGQTNAFVRLRQTNAFVRLNQPHHHAPILLRSMATPAAIHAMKMAIFITGKKGRIPVNPMKSASRLGSIPLST